MSRPVSWPSRLVRTPAPDSVQNPEKGRLSALAQFSDLLLGLPITGDCCVYPGAIVNGFPTIRVDGKQQYLHLHWWRLFHQRSPRSRLTSLCQTPQCVSPLHWVEAIPSQFLLDASPAHAIPLNQSPVNPQISQISQISPISPTSTENKPLDLCKSAYLSTQNNTTSSFSSCEMDKFREEMRNDLNYIFSVEGLPKTWQALRDHVPLWQCPDDILISLIQDEPRIAHLRPDTGYLGD